MRKTLIFLGALGLAAYPAYGQLNPVIRPVPKPVVPKPVAGVKPIIGIAKPTLRLDGSSERTPGKLHSMSVVVGNLGDAKAAHLIALNYGCPVDAQPGVSGLSLVPSTFGVSATVFTSDATGRSRADTSRSDLTSVTFDLGDKAGQPVNAAGEARFSLTGIVAVDPVFTSAVSGSPPFESMQQTNQYARFLRSVTKIDLNNNTCAPSAIVATKDSAGTWTVLSEQGQRLPAEGRYVRSSLSSDLPLLTKGSPWFLHPHRRVTIEKSADLTALLNPAAKSLSLGSTCSGTSETFAGKFPVGVGTVDGDITYTIRSGPAGTRCLFATEAALLPEGVKIVERRYSVSKVGDRCQVTRRSSLPADAAGSVAQAIGHMSTIGFVAIRALLTGSTANASTGVGGFSLDRIAAVTNAPTEITGNGSFGGSTHGWLNPFKFPEPGDRYRWNNYLNPTIAILQCDATAVNDHQVRLRLDRVVVELPTGVRFP